MNGSINIGSIKNTLAHFFERFESLIFFIAIAVLMLAALLSLLEVFTPTQAEPSALTETIITESEKDSVSDLEASSSENKSDTDITPPSGRFSPFFEGEWINE